MKVQLQGPIKFDKARAGPKPSNGSSKPAVANVDLKQEVTCDGCHPTIIENEHEAIQCGNCIKTISSEVQILLTYPCGLSKFLKSDCFSSVGC